MNPVIVLLAAFLFTAVSLLALSLYSWVGKQADKDMDNKF